jgi:two-component system phosphate regulon sensor histidine kinase PhoR
MLALIASIAGLPTIVLLGAAIMGWVRIWAAVGIAGGTVGVAATVACIIRRDERMLSQIVRRLAAGGPEPGVSMSAGPIFMESLGREIEHLTRRAAPRAALVEQMRRTDTLILDSLPDPMIVLAGDRSVRRANKAAQAAYGDDMAAVLRHPDLRSAIDRTFASGTVQTAELTLPVPVERDVRASVVPMDPPLADGGRAIVVLSDRTRERIVERMRADFVANVSHELRTPLTSLIGFVETLQGPASDDPPAQQRFLGIMAEQGARMNRLIDDLLSLSRIELTEHQSPSETVDLKELIAGIVAGFEPRLMQRKTKIDSRFAEELPLIIGDADQIAQVVQNLLDNALKYGRDGGTIRLAVERAQPGARWPARAGVVIAVGDRGAGIPREHIPRLTERFYRVDKGRSRAVGGTGLGLAIVKHIVNRHRGQMSIESEVGVGTKVSVWLPLSQPGAANRVLQ